MELAKRSKVTMKHNSNNTMLSSIYWLRILSVGDIENFRRREGVKLVEKKGDGECAHCARSSLSSVV